MGTEVLEWPKIPLTATTPKYEYLPQVPQHFSSIDCIMVSFPRVKIKCCLIEIKGQTSSAITRCDLGEINKCVSISSSEKQYLPSEVL